MPSLWVNNKDSSGSDRRERLWNFIEENSLVVQALKSHRSSFILSLDDANLDKFLSRDITSKLAKIKFELRTPLEYAARRTLVVKGVDERILNRNNDEISVSLV